MAPTTLTTQEVAKRLKTDPRTLRRFLRSQESPIRAVGQGNRYGVQAPQVKALNRAFKTWQTKHTRQAA